MQVSLRKIDTFQDACEAKVLNSMSNVDHFMIDTF